MNLSGFEFRLAEIKNSAIVRCLTCGRFFDAVGRIALLYSTRQLCLYGPLCRDCAIAGPKEIWDVVYLAYKAQQSELAKVFEEGIKYTPDERVSLFKTRTTEAAELTARIETSKDLLTKLILLPPEGWLLPEQLETTDHI